MKYKYIFTLLFLLIVCSQLISAQENIIDPTTNTTNAIYSLNESRALLIDVFSTVNTQQLNVGITQTELLLAKKMNHAFCDDVIVQKNSLSSPMQLECKTILGQHQQAQATLNYELEDLTFKSNASVTKQLTYAGEENTTQGFFEFEPLSITFTGLIGNPKYNVQGEFPYITVPVGSESKLSIYFDNKLHTTVTTGSLESSFVYVDILLKLKDVFQRESQKPAENVIAWYTRAPSTNNISLGSVIGKDYTLLDVIYQWNPVLKNTPSQKALELHNLKNQGFRIRNNNTLYEFGDKPNHNRFLYEAGVIINKTFIQTQTYDSIAQSEVFNLQMPRYIVGNDAKLYENPFYALNIFTLPNSIIIEPNFNYNLVGSQMKNKKDISITFQSTPAQENMNELKLIAQNKNISGSQQWLKNITRTTKKGVNHINSQLYESETTRILSNGNILREGVVVGHITNNGWIVQ